LKNEVSSLLQLDLSNPINTILIVVMLVIIVIWIVTELRYEGVGKGAIRIACALILSVMFMVLMYISGLIYF
jgi:hypothetical protein